ncbi:hypothetical protein [Carboxylicivirga taeanensis]|uniref:hypothetical protein n=1 Tax=Carboxylicivirga taeanensis TaxID=1416875 RepID=UPI003F6E3788
MEQVKSNNYSLAKGGLLYVIIMRIRCKLLTKYNHRNRAIVMASLTWLPLAVLSVVYLFTEERPEGISFFEDITMHTRFLVVVPLLILLEKPIDNVFAQYLKTTEQLIAPNLWSDFKMAMIRVDKFTSCWLSEVIILIIIYCMIILGWEELNIFQSGRECFVDWENGDLTIAGWYLIIFSLPVYQFLIFRWLWRFIIWTFCMWKFSGYKFKLEAMHTDQMAGLGYFNLFPLYFSMLVMVASTVYASIILMHILYDGSTLVDHLYGIVFYILFIDIIIYAPLLIYFPLLMETKTRAIHSFGSLITEHNVSYMERWVYKRLKKETILGSIDNSSLNDINGSYMAVMDMKIVPIDVRMFLTSLVFISIPFFPLVFTLYSPTELFRNIINATLGT